EYPKHDDQFPPARTHPEPYRLPGSLDSPQHVIRENNKAHQRRQLVTIYPPCPWRIVTSSSAVLSSAKESQTNPTVMYRMLWPKTTQNGSKTRHHDQCASTVSLRTAKIRQTNPDQ